MRDMESDLDDSQDMDESTDEKGRAICGANLRQEREDGRTVCVRRAGWGTDHLGIGRCSYHGGKTRNHGKSAQVEQARRDVRLWAGRRDIHPADALLELVQTKAAEVEYWRIRVSEMDEADLTYGVTKNKIGGDDFGTTEESKPHVALVMLHEAEVALANFSAASLKAGVDEERVRIAQSKAAWAITMIRRFAELAQVEVSRTDEILIEITREAVQG